MKRTTASYQRKAAEILSHICYATLATVCPDGTPWNSPVSAVYDYRLHIYWFSDKASQHAHNVRANSNVFIVFYDSTWPEGAGGQGLYIRGKAYELADPDEILQARRLKKGQQPDDLLSFTGEGVRRVYKAVPERLWMNDIELANDGTFIRDYRVRLFLADVRSCVRKV